MAITNAQQYQQLVNKPAGNKRPGYAGRDRDYQQRGQSKQSYSTSRQQQNFSARDNSPTRSRIQEDRQKDFEQNPNRYKTNVSGDGEGSNILSIINPFSKERRKLSYNASMLIPGQKKRSTTMQKAYRDYLKSMGVTPPDTLTGEEDDLAEFFVENAFDRTSPSYKDPITDEVKNIQNYGNFIAENFGAPGVMMSGNVGGLEKFVKTRDADGKPLTYGYTEKRGDGDGMSDYERRLLALEQSMSPTTEPEVDPDSLEGMLANRVAYRFMADGGMTNDAPVEGGIMDLESGRQMYFLGKLVKKATRAVKKIAKSPIGKAALLYAGGSFLGGGGGGLTSIFGKDAFLRKTLLPKLYKDGAMTGLGKIALGGALTAAPLLFQEEEEEPDYANNRGPGLDINAIRSNPYNTMGSSYRFFAEGGDVEPVAKETMPLIDMDGKEMDLRADGGFVPIGRMERADDVPARLSKNEFVFTADAVRNAGEGDIDKGAEVMYNMMKNLESGGEVSEESQGLDGAREMFQTSQRLEEVL
jgi:hypothetical protein